MARQPEKQTATTEGAGQSRFQQLSIRVGVIAVVALLILLAGWLLGRAPVGELRAQVETLETQRAEAASRADANEALALLYRTALDLEARNFGVANERLDRSGTLLGRVDAEVLGVSAEQLNQLRQAIEVKDLTVAADLDDQRSQVLRYARELRQLIPEAPQAP